MYFAFHIRNLLRVLSIGLCTVLSACDASKTNGKLQNATDSQSSSSEIVEQKIAQQHSVSEGKKLSDVAGQATLPVVDEFKKDHHPDTISDKAQSFVGRYHTQISCEDPFALCEKGRSEYIINLLPDGTAHRTFVYMGKITYENNDIKSERTFKKNKWVYDENTHEIIVDRIEGIHFYYKIDANHNLVMDLDKILNGTEANKRYFQQHHTAPTKAYVLTKFDN